MINTFHTSYNPPPVPPRAGYSKPRPPGNTSLVKFLSVMLLLLMILTFGGFLYLFQKFDSKDTVSLQMVNDCAEGNMHEDCEKYRDTWGKILQANGKPSTDKLTGGPSLNGPAAHMVLQNEHKDKSGLNVLLWDQKHSLLQDVHITSKGDMLTIKKPGIYFIYSQVTFSRQSKSTLTQALKTKLANKEKPELLRSYCSLNQNTSGLCTASMTGIFELHEKQQLYVTVTNTSLVNRNYCSFGLFRLW